MLVMLCCKELRLTLKGVDNHQKLTENVLNEGCDGRKFMKSRTMCRKLKVNKQSEVKSRSWHVSWHSSIFHPSLTSDRCYSLIAI